MIVGNDENLVSEIYVKMHWYCYNNIILLCMQKSKVEYDRPV